MTELQNSEREQKFNRDQYTPCAMVCNDRTDKSIMGGSKKIHTKQKWREEWRNFVDNTTLHGLRYISMEHAFILRRLLWLLLVLFCLIGMSYQILDRIIYYYKSPVNVNVKVNYNESLIFPALTLCNQNAFKATLAAENNWYRLIESMYNGSSQDFIINNLKSLNASDIQIDRLFRKAAHIKKDLIVGCTWADNPCSHANFTTVLTDHGLCYTFNSPLNNAFEPRIAKATGADRGLKLLLNVEQYEYMPGPNDAAGIKLLAHDHNDFPRVRELGISIPAGSHAFVGLKVLKIQNLPYPHGQCEAKKLKYFKSYSYDGCQLECLTGELYKKCGCRNFYMPNISETPPVCTLKEYYGCFLSSYENLRQDLRIKCDCPTPCQYNLYDPVLSYGTISAHAAEKLLDMTNSTQLKKDLELARETSNRMEAKKFNKYVQSISNMENALFNIKQLFVNKIIDKVTLQLHHVEERYKQIDKVWKKKSFLYRYQIYVVQKNFIRGRDAMEERTLSHLCNAFFEFVYFIETNLGHLSTEESNTTNKGTFHTLLIDALNNRLENAKRALANYTVLYNAYQNGTPIFRYRYYRIPRKNNDYIVPKPLLQRALNHNAYARKYGPRMENDIERIIRSLTDYIELTNEVFVTNILNISQMRNYSGDFIDGCEDYYHSKSVLYFESVEWPVKILETRKHKFQDAKDEYETVRDIITSNLENLHNSLNAINSDIIKHLDYVVNISNSYRFSNDITKISVATTILSTETEKVIENCKQFFQEIRVRAQNVYDGWTQLIGKAADIWKPILNDPDMLEYYNFINKSDFLANFSTVKSELESDYTQIRNENDLRFLIGNEDFVFINSFDNLKVELAAFLRSTNVDENVLKNNFLQLDIFYRELNYEEIRQQVAYDIFALLCDIGGSMGLFVGASVMTMFELIDLFANSSAKRLFKYT